MIVYLDRFTQDVMKHFDRSIIAVRYCCCACFGFVCECMGSCIWTLASIKNSINFIMNAILIILFNYAMQCHKDF